VEEKEKKKWWRKKVEKKKCQEEEERNGVKFEYLLTNKMDCKVRLKKIFKIFLTFSLGSG
jgi:hypothetical protein